MYWVLIEASSDLQWDTSEPVQAKDGALMLLRSVLAENVEAPATAAKSACLICDKIEQGLFFFYASRKLT